MLIRGNASSFVFSSFRVSASVFSVKFRVNPWLILLLVLPSVANLNNKTNYALYLNKYLNSIIKNHQGRVR